MRTCMFVCVNVYLCVFVVYNCMYVCASAYTFECTFVCACVYTFSVCSCVHVCVLEYVC